MTKRRIGLRVAAVLALVATACDRGPTAPRGTTPGVVRLDLVGPGSVAPGTSVQFTAIEHLSNGTTRDVTRDASWASSGPALSVSDSGLVTGLVNGEETLTVRSPTRTASREVVIVPDGTFRLNGLVTESGLPTVRIPAAQVEVLSEAGVLSTVTGGDGRYRVYGARGQTELRFTRAGYEFHVQRVPVTGHQTVDIELTLTRPRIEAAGRYTFSITAAAQCRPALPQDTWSRTYLATVSQAGPRLTVSLQGNFDGGGFARLANSFFGSAESDRLTFRISQLEDWYFSAEVMENFAPGLYFVPTGTIEMRESPAGFSGTLDGVIDVRQATGFDSRSVTSCRADAHQTALTR